jgi:hypothetical protein
MEEVQALTLASAAPYRFNQVESGIRVVVSDALPVSAGTQFEQWLTAAVRDVRPHLKPFVHATHVAPALTGRIATAQRLNQA